MCIAARRGPVMLDFVSATIRTETVEVATSSSGGATSSEMPQSCSTLNNEQNLNRKKGPLQGNSGFVYFLLFS